MTIRNFPQRWGEPVRRLLCAGLLASVAAFAGAQTGAGQPPVTLRFTVWDGDVSLNIIRGVLQEFERENPDIHVKLENFPDYATYHQKMLVQYAANVAPDVAMMDPGHFQALANRKAILPLNPFFKDTPGFDINAYYKPIVEAHTLNGQLYVLPRDIAPEGILYYNRKAFREAGLPYPDGTWTWDFKERPELKNKDFLWVMHQLTKIGKGPKPERYGFVPAYPGLLADTFMYSYGLKYADNDQNPTKVLLNDPRMVDVYNLVIDLADDKKWMPSNTEVTNDLQQSTEQLFVQQKVAIYQNGIWDVPNVRRDNKPGTKDFFDWDVTLFPAYANGHHAAPTGGSGYCIFSSTKYPRQAWRLTRFMAGPVAMAAMARAGIAQPAIRSLALTKGVWLPGPNTPPEQMWPANRIVTDQAVPWVQFGPTAEYWPDVSNMISAQTGSIFNDLISPKDGLKQANEDGQKRLDQLRKDESLSPFNWPLGLTAAALIVAGIVTVVYWPERKVRYTTRQKAESRSAYRFLAPWLIGLVVFTLGPMILSLLMSFMNWDMIRPAQWRGVHNYTEAFFEDPRFWISLRVTAVFTLVSTPLGIFFAFLLALLLNQKVKGVALFRSMYYIPAIASSVALTLVARKILSPDDGLLNTVIYKLWPLKETALGHVLSAYAGKPNDMVDWLGSERTALASVIMISLAGVGATMVVLLAGLQGIPQYYYEAATVDGANPLQRMKAITLPLLTPAIFFSLITGFIGSFQVFTQVFIITNGQGGGPNNSLLVYMISIFSAAFQTLRMGYAAALGWVLFLIIMLFTLLQIRMSKWVYYEADAK